MRMPLHIRNHVSRKNRREWCYADMMLLLRLIVIGLLVMAGALICTGCSQPPTQKKGFALSNPFYRSRPHRAMRMTCLWEPRMLSDKQENVRGFQGEIIFFRDDKMQEPTIVDGNLTVYIFDADDHRVVDFGGVEGIKPLAEYKFDKETLDRGLSKNKKAKMISYGLWLPIDKMPGNEMNLVLWTRFEGSAEDGEMLNSDQLTVYLPGNPVEKKKSPENGTRGIDGIQQAGYDDIYDFSNVQLSSYTEATLALQNKEKSRKYDDTVIPMSPAMTRQFFNAARNSEQTTEQNEPIPSQRQATGSGIVGFGSGDAVSTQTNEKRQSQQQPRENNMALGFGNGDLPHGTSGQQPSQMLSRYRSNVSSVGGEINQRMQSGNFAATIDQPVQQVSYVSDADQNRNDAQSARKAEARQVMTQMMIEQERRRQQEKTVNDQGFSTYNANSFASNQNRITVPPDRYGWGMSAPSQDGQATSTGQPSNHSAQSRYPTQGQGTSQPAYVESDWGPGLEQTRSNHETQVTYSQNPATRTYR